MKNTVGTIGIVACPMLEDELIHGIISDQDEKCIYVLNNEFTTTLCHKLDVHHIKYNMMSRFEIDSSMMNIDKNKFNLVIMMNTIGLHDDPKKLKKYIEEQLVALQGRFDVVALYYGLCGNFGWDVSKWAKKHVCMPVITFRDNEDHVCDDCVCVAVGGQPKYLELIKRYTGMLFLTPATATNWDEYKEYDEFFKHWGKSYDESVKELMEMCGYKYALKVDTGLGDREIYQMCCEQVADSLGLELIEADDGWGTSELAVKMYHEAKSCLHGAQTDSQNKM